MKGKQMSMKLGFNTSGVTKLGEVEIPSCYFNRFGTGTSTIDNLFGDGGFIAGQVITLSAARGCGKTTMLLQVLEGVIRNNPDKRCLYLSGEEYVAQLAFMARRIDTPNVLADNITDVNTIAQMTKDYDVIVIDSMAALTNGEMRSRQEIECYAMNTLYKAAKENECVVIFILHQTKDGKSCGRSSIEHTADTCIKIFNVDSEEFGELNAKAFCVDKNRFGMTKDSIFRMTAKGWDFQNPIREDFDKNKSKADVRSDKIQGEMEKILALKRFQMKDLGTISTDLKVLARLARRVNELVKTGRIKKVGRGDGAVYSVKG
jgi:predicted ATP-dependent serine protease